MLFCTVAGVALADLGYDLACQHSRPANFTPSGCADLGAGATCSRNLSTGNIYCSSPAVGLNCNYEDLEGEPIEVTVQLYEGTCAWREHIDPDTGLHTGIFYIMCVGEVTSSALETYYHKFVHGVCAPANLALMPEQDSGRSQPKYALVR